MRYSFFRSFPLLRDSNRGANRTFASSAFEPLHFSCFLLTNLPDSSFLVLMDLDSIFSSVSNTNPLHSSVSLTSLPSSTFSPPQALATTTIYAIIYASSPAAIVSSSTVAPVSSSSKNSTLEAYAAGQDYSNYSFTMLGTSSHPLSPSHHLT